MKTVKPTLFDRVMSDSQYWGDNGNGEWLPKKETDIPPVTHREKMKVASEARKTLVQFMSVTNLKYVELIPFEQECKGLEKAYKSAHNKAYNACSA